MLSRQHFDEVIDTIKNITTSTYDRQIGSLESTGLVHHHHTHPFPEDTDESVTFVAGSPANTFGSWAEIVDNLGVKLSDKLTLNAQITAILIESCSVTDKVYFMQIAYGDAKIVIACYRFVAGQTVFLPAIQQMRIRTTHIPPTEKIYYRMKCETASADCNLHLRYYLQD